MDLGLKDKCAVITGGASGLGRATAQLLHDEGAHVLLADLNEDTLQAAEREMRDGKAGVESFRVDVRNYEDCQGMVAAAIDSLGQVDILVNSAGIGGDYSFFAEAQPEQWTDLIEINLLGVMNCCRAVTDHMAERGYGKIVSLASEAGKANEKRMVVYGVTKGGVISLTRGLALELGRHSINVNAVCPGVTKTPMTAYVTDEMEQAASRFYPLGRLGTPDDIAPMIAFLASDRAAWITGQAISISGGFGRS